MIRGRVCVGEICIHIFFEFVCVCESIFVFFDVEPEARLGVIRVLYFCSCNLLDLPCTLVCIPEVQSHQQCLLGD